jgi:O-antigen ligase
VIIGFVLPVLPALAQLALALMVALPVFAFTARSWLSLGMPPRAGPSAEEEESPEVRASDYRAARWLTYLGLGTLALLTLRPTPALTVSDWIFLAALLVAVLGYAHESRRIHIAPPRLMLAGVAMVLIGALLSLPNALDGTESLAAVARFVYLTVGWFALAGYSLRTTRDVSIATRFWVASVALSGAAAAAQLLWGNVIPGTIIANGRMTGFAQHVTDLGGMCAVALIPAVSFLDVRGLSPVRRIASAVLVALVLAGLLLSGSVDGFMSAAVGLALWVWIGGAARRGLGLLLGLGALLVIVAGAAAQLGLVLPEARIASVLSSPDDPYATFYLRLEAFNSAWQWIQASPLFGVGFDLASATTATGEVVHNVLIATWFEGGVLALLGIVLVLLSAAGTARNAWAMAKSSESRRLAAALFAAVGSAITFSMANPILFQRYVWVPVFLAIALVSHQRRPTISASHIQPAVMDGAGRASISIRSST